MTDHLVVKLGPSRVGRLRYERKQGVTFAYDPAWLAEPGAVPLSASLPLRSEPFPDAIARPWFANLLPEGEARAIIARLLRTAEGNDFALLAALGGECAGAVQLLPEGGEERGSGGYRELSRSDLDELLADLHRRPLLAGQDGARLSLAGAQAKLPLYIDAGRYFLPYNGAPSSHIFKPVIPGFPGSDVDELICMRLAKAADLPVPSVFRYVGRASCYVVERFDRERDEAGRLVRVHQEDFCQALAVPPELKYEQDGGPGLSGCFDLLSRKSAQPGPDRLALLDWTIFNYLTGNADNHAKNLALLHRPGGTRLAPFYDLLSTALYPQLTDKLAMRIGGEQRPRWVMPRHWERLAEAAQIRWPLVRRRLAKLAERLSALVEQVEAEDPAVRRAIAAVVERRSGWVRQRLAG